MCVIWDSEPINSTKLHKICLEKLGWRKSTTYTMIRKLSEKKLIKNENAVVSAIVKKDEIKKYESEQLVTRVFDNSLPHFISAFLQGNKITQKEADEIRKMIEEVAKE